MVASSKKDHKTFDSSVYAPINKCMFIPNCAFENEVTSETINGFKFEVFKSDNRAYIRGVISDELTGAGICGVLVNLKTSEIVWQECAQSERGKGYTRSLRCLLTPYLRRPCWAVHLTPLGAASMGG